ncbi:hypothetical protein Fot_15600 [Forsythia ovata]|uniref:Uncharacterized protein n=1 Tax=Forsythia ovata TaxID=205694 RepID=A0ABD1W9W8_9LAMI
MTTMVMVVVDFSMTKEVVLVSFQVAGNQFLELHVTVEQPELPEWDICNSIHDGDQGPNRGLGEKRVISYSTAVDNAPKIFKGYHNGVPPSNNNRYCFHALAFAQSRVARPHAFDISP